MRKRNCYRVLSFQTLTALCVVSKLCLSAMPIRLVRQNSPSFTGWSSISVHRLGYLLRKKQLLRNRKIYVYILLEVSQHVGTFLIGNLLVVSHVDVVMQLTNVRHLSLMDQMMYLK